MVINSSHNLNNADLMDEQLKLTTLPDATTGNMRMAFQAAVTLVANELKMKADELASAIEAFFKQPSNKFQAHILYGKNQPKIMKDLLARAEKDFVSFEVLYSGRIETTYGIQRKGNDVHALHICKQKYTALAKDGKRSEKEKLEMMIGAGRGRLKNSAGKMWNHRVSSMECNADRGKPEHLRSQPKRIRR